MPTAAQLYSGRYRTVWYEPIPPSAVSCHRRMHGRCRRSRKMKLSDFCIRQRKKAIMSSSCWSSARGCGAVRYWHSNGVTWTSQQANCISSGRCISSRQRWLYRHRKQKRPYARWFCRRHSWKPLRRIRKRWIRSGCSRRRRITADREIRHRLENGYNWSWNGRTVKRCAFTICDTPLRPWRWSTVWMWKRSRQP